MSKVYKSEKTLRNRQKPIIPTMPNEASNDKANSRNDNTPDASILYTCVMCKQTFNSHNNLQKHFKEHGRNEIDLRGRPMLESTLLKHPKKKISFELIECEWCPEAFQNISKAIEHKFRKHRYESTNYFCELCGKLFPLKIALEQHVSNEHKNDSTKTNLSVKKKPAFQCHYCKVPFQTSFALEFHEKCVHQLEKRLLKPTIVPPPSKKIKLNNSEEVISVYYCHLCGSEYMLKYNLRNHIEKHHTELERTSIPLEGVIKCKACESIFYSKRAFDSHDVHHKPDDLYVTSEEQRRQIVARVDQDFDINRVPTIVEKYIPPISKKKRLINKPSTSRSRKSKLDSDNESMSPVSLPDTSDEENTDKI